MNRAICYITGLLFCLSLALSLCACKGKEKEIPKEEKEIVALSMYSEVEINPQVLAMIKQKLGIRLEMIYPGEGKRESVEKMIAIGEIPDIIYTESEGSQMVEAGILMDTRYLLRDYAKNITAQYENGVWNMYYNPEDERVLFLPVPQGMLEKPESSNCVWLQYGMMSDYHYQAPDSLDELGDLLRQYKKKSEEQNGEKIIGITFLCEEDTWLSGLSLAAGMIADGIEEQGQWLVDSANGYEVTYKHTTVQEKEFFRWLNQMYTEGILDSDFATQTSKDYMEKIRKGKAVCILDSSIYMHRSMEYLVERGNMENAYMAAAVKLYQGQKWVVPKEGEKRGQGLGITTSCKYPQEAVKMIDFMFGSQGGKELSAIEESDNSIWEKLRKYEEGIREEDEIEADRKEAADKDCYARDIQQSDYELDELTKQLDEIAREGLIQCIICGEDDFEKKWQSLQRSLQKAGVQRAQAIMTGKYRDYAA